MKHFHGGLSCLCVMKIVCHCSDKRWVYAIWTMTLSEDPQASGQQDALRELGPKAEDGEESRGEQGGFDFSQSGEDLPGIKLSGETVFEMGASGLVGPFHHLLRLFLRSIHFFG